MSNNKDINLYVFVDNGTQTIIIDLEKNLLLSEEYNNRLCELMPEHYSKMEYRQLFSPNAPVKRREHPGTRRRFAKAPGSV